ncbi:625_t:CDS:2 [Acaulospora colombiana]|uniref:625_t:CDS:1 n=1 Tax=Acaulospora colombiana TaxID=27376 RepID=A0ACA9LEZ0_9GLOM|nr:625_t:CDS:2 [Acaulospora colombiana]
MTANTSSHLTPPPSSLGHMNNERVGDEIVSTACPSLHKNPPSPRTQSKSILTVALQKAQTAVQFDAANNVVAALESYKQTVELLSQHDTYADRIRLLSTIAPESDGASSNDASSTDQDPDFVESENNDKSSKSEQSLEQGSVIEPGTVTTQNVRKADFDVQGSTPNDGDNGSIDMDSNQFNKDRSLDFNRNPLNQQNNDAEKIIETKDIGAIDNISTKDNLIEKEYEAPVQSKRFSNLSHKSDSSTLIDKPYINKTVPEPTNEREKSIADTNGITEFVVGSENSASNTDVAESFDAKLQEQGKQVTDQDLSKERSLSSSSPSQIETEIPPKNTTERRTPSHVFVPPPPPKIAPPSNNSQPSISPSLLPSTTNNALLPISASETTTDLLSNLAQEENDDKASVKSASLESNKSPQSRRPTPLSLDKPEIYNSRSLLHTPSPSNPNNLTGFVQPSSNYSHSSGFPKRTASNPGNSSRKSTVRFFSQSQSTLTSSFTQTLSQIPGTPSPWSNNLGIPPPLGSPGLRSDQTNSPKTPQSGYISCLMNPLPNTLLNDEDLGLPTVKNSALPEPPPKDIHLRPFWLMRLLERTMTTGGYLTPKLYIPCNLWLQGHAKLTAIDTKISSCDVVLNCLIRLSKTSIDDIANLSRELEGIESIIEGLQNSLARKLSYVESTNGKSRQSTSSLMNWGSKLSRSLDKMGMSNAMVRSEEANGYVDVLIKVFQNADVVGKRF